jgi:small-conductance mechanosensitive channel
MPSNLSWNDVWNSWNDVWNIAELPARVVFILVLGLFSRWLIHRVINSLAVKASGLQPPKRLLGGKAAEILQRTSSLYNERRAQRAQALASLFKSITTGVISVLVVLMALDQMEFSLAPLLASAGIAGAAIGFGAQTLVRDFISGVFMLIEDQYGVGDVIDMGEAIGTVEGVGLRVTRLRGFDGVLWHVRNGEVIRVGNRTQGWSRLWLEVNVAYDEDLERAERLVKEVIDEVADDEEWRDQIVEKPTVLGVEQVNGVSVTVRVFGRCKAEEQYGVERELRERIKASFDAAGVRVPPPFWPTQPQTPAPPQ